jgi:hypothetical protein
MDHQMPEELMARFEELSALEHEFEDVEEEISKYNFSTMRNSVADQFRTRCKERARNRAF